MKIAFMGDVMLGRLVNENLLTVPPEYPWGNTLPILQEADLRICNLECVLSDIGEPWPGKAFNFRSDEKNIETLKIANINMVSLANNHVLDYDKEALERMIHLLDKYGIQHAGANKSFAKCSVNGKTIGMIAFTDNEPEWEAEGVNYVPTDLNDARAKKLFEQIKNTKVDFLIISAHWGSNWGRKTPQEHITFAHALIDAGANLVFGHSPHIYREIEYYKNRPILYSTGDFIDDYAVDPIEKNDESFIFMYEDDKITLHPTKIQNFQVNLSNKG